MESEGFFTNVPFYNEQRFHTEGKREEKKPHYPFKNVPVVLVTCKSRGWYSFWSLQKRLNGLYLLLPMALIQLLQKSMGVLAVSSHSCLDQAQGKQE